MLTAAQLCESLVIPPARLAEWKQEGLPYTKKGRAHLFDERAVRIWLLRHGKAVETVVKTQAEVSLHFKVSTRQVQRWLTVGCPGVPGAYDLDAIAAWKDERDGNKRDRTPQGPADAALARYRLAKAEQAELELAIAKREQIPIAELRPVLEQWAHQGRAVIRTLDKQIGQQAGDLVRDWIRATTPKAPPAE